MYINCYKNDKAKNLIIDLLLLEGYPINQDCIKIHTRDFMIYDDMLRGIAYVKSIGKNAIVFTNKVRFKERIAKEQGIAIFDVDDFEKLIDKHKYGYSLLNFIIY